jgi:hypothetical protein
MCTITSSPPPPPPHLSPPSSPSPSSSSSVSYLYHLDFFKVTTLEEVSLQKCVPSPPLLLLLLLLPLLSLLPLLPLPFLLSFLFISS